MRAFGRRRRLRIQLPLGGAGLLIGLAGIGATITAQGYVFGGMGMALGGWLLLLSVTSTDTWAINLSICVTTILIATAVYQAVGGARVGVPVPAVATRTPRIR